jgi:hypothetical protein
MTLNKLVLTGLAIFGLISFSSTFASNTLDIEAPITYLSKIPNKRPIDSVFNVRGGASFIYSGYLPLKDKPVKVHYYFPTTGDVATMPVLFSFHGVERNGLDYLNRWKYFAEKYHFIVIAPEFSKEYFSENEYQFGGVFTSKTYKTLNLPEKWTYNIVESLFSFFVEKVNSNANTYKMFGHSAGAQFVHRYLIAMPEARVDRAVAANAGSWTFPFKEGLAAADGKKYGWPYSISGTPFSSKKYMTAFLNRNFWIQLGQLDTSTVDKYLPKNNAAMAQGKMRLERGRNYFEACKQIAQTLNTPFSLKTAEVKESNHSSLRMIYGRKVSKIEDVTHPGINSAYRLLFEED